VSAREVKRALKEKADPVKAAFYPTFFKAGPGEYAEGDKFIGVVVPEQRKIAKQFSDLSLSQIRTLTKDAFHECRLTALFILIHKFDRADETEQTEIAGFYLSQLDYVNNWDLVDSSAEKILGQWLVTRDRRILYDLADTDNLWRPRVAMIATYAFIKAGDFKDTIKIATRLLNHDHDLIHKAVGWMLREVGNRNLAVEERFLKKHYMTMSRTMLRYAIEKFPEPRRKAYLASRT
jgi:3-methyladenine DNA glycosylase AlkD